MGRKLIKRFLREDLFKLLKVGRCLPCQHPCQFRFLILSAVGWTAVENDPSIPPEDRGIMLIEPVISNEHGSFPEIRNEHGPQLLVLLNDHPHDDKLSNVACPV